MNSILRKYLILRGYRLNNLAKNISVDSLTLSLATHGHPSLTRETINRVIDLLNPKTEDIEFFLRLEKKDFGGGCASN